MSMMVVTTMKSTMILVVTSAILCLVSPGTHNVGCGIFVQALSAGNHNHNNAQLETPAHWNRTGIREFRHHLKHNISFRNSMVDVWSYYNVLFQGCYSVPITNNNSNAPEQELGHDGVDDNRSSITLREQIAVFRFQSQREPTRHFGEYAIPLQTFVQYRFQQLAEQLYRDDGFWEMCARCSHCRQDCDYENPNAINFCDSSEDGEVDCDTCQRDCLWNELSPDVDPLAYKDTLEHLRCRKIMDGSQRNHYKGPICTEDNEIEFGVFSDEHCRRVLLPIEGESDLVRGVAKSIQSFGSPQYFAELCRLR